MIRGHSNPPRTYSHALEKHYYSRSWPIQAQPFLHLEPYLRCWSDPDKIFRGKRVLDIGAGECTYTRLIAERFAPASVVGCELFPERMQPAADVNQRRNLRFVAGDCFQLPFRDSSLDVVFGSFILHQIPNLDPVVSEIQRVLSKNGRYVGIEPNPFHPLHLYRYLRGKHSKNQYLLRSKNLDAFRKTGFAVKLRYFYAKLPWLRGPFLGTCIGIVAERRP